LRAITVLGGALSSYADTHGRDKALYLMFLAETYLEADEVEQSCAIARRAMDLPPSWPLNATARDDGDLAR